VRNRGCVPLLEATDSTHLLLVRFYAPHTVAAYDSLSDAGNPGMLDHVWSLRGSVVGVHGDSIEVRVKSMWLLVSHDDGIEYIPWRPDDHVPSATFVRFNFHDADQIRYYGAYDEARTVAGVLILAWSTYSILLVAYVPIHVTTHRW
jgi:hypothetical protein